MKETKTVKLVTIGKIIEELIELENGHLEVDVVCCQPDDSMGYIVGTELDKDGDVCIFLDEEYEDSCCYNVEMLSSELQVYDKNARVYIKGSGLLFGIEEGNFLFEYDEMEDVVSCNCIKIGNYKEESHQGRGYGWLMEAEIRENEENERRRKVIDKRETIVLAILTLCLVVGLIYNVYAIVTHSGVHREIILWGIVCLVCVIFCSLTLYYSKNNK